MKDIEDKKTNYNLKIILPLVLLGLILTVFLASMFFMDIFKKHTQKQTIDVQSEEVISINKSPSVCTNTENLEVYTYKETPVLWEENNKFGLYIYAENRDFFEIAQNLVNSNGGDWGYVLIPYNVKDRDFDKWSRVFEQLRNKRLIPVIQLWDLDPEHYVEQTREAAYFLNQFIWPIKYKYISVYNETNDAKFWRGRVDPEEYAIILDYTIRVFKEEHPDFFILNGAFNVSASTNSTYMDSFEYMRRMNGEVSGIFDKLDGWASHPYPQPNFSGSPDAEGRWSIRSYEDELEFLENELGLQKELPVFITETGWAHAEGHIYNSSYYPVDTISEYFKRAFEAVWLKDDRVRAVMPFTIRYKPPFDYFSWINEDNVPYNHYNVVKSIEKIEGQPPVLEQENLIINSCD